MGQRRRAVVGGLVVSGLLFAAYLFVVIAPIAGTFGFDAFAYWSFPRADPYYLPEGHLGSFVYSPVVARLFAPFALLGWYPFVVLWTAVLVATAVWLGGWRDAPAGPREAPGLRGLFPRRLGWLAVLAFPPVAVELYHGNVQLLIAAAIALGFRYPAAWAVVLVSKVTPGFGLLWFLVRREWRSLAIALGVTAVIVAISIVIDPGLWRQWLEREVAGTLRVAPDQPQIAIPLWLRLPAAAALVAWGARTDRRWTVIVAGAIAMPVLWVTSFSVLAALGTVGRPELEPRSAATLAGVAPRRAEAVP
jgi:glycosyl transferase family 87